MFTYEIKNSRQIQDQACVYIEEVSSGVFIIVKNRYGSRNTPITSKEVMEILRVNEKVAFLDINMSIYTNFIPVLRKFDDILSRFQDDNLSDTKEAKEASTEEIRKQLSNMTRKVRMQRAKENYRPTHVVFMSNEEDESMQCLFCFEEQVDDIKNFLQDKVDTLIITELGKDLVRFTK